MAEIFCFNQGVNIYTIFLVLMIKTPGEVTQM